MSINLCSNSQYNYHFSIKRSGLHLIPRSLAAGRVHSDYEFVISILIIFKFYYTFCMSKSRRDSGLPTNPEMEWSVGFGSVSQKAAGREWLATSIARHIRFGEPETMLAGTKFCV